MTTDAELVAAILAAPDDMQLRLVYADWLIANGDERGELITFDEAERRGHFQRFVDDSALHRLMTLAARHGFHRFATDPDDAPLTFARGRVEYDGHEYRFERSRWSLVVYCVGEHDEVRYPNQVDSALHDPAREWTARELEVIPMLATRAVRLGRPLKSIDVPYAEAIEELDRLGARPDHTHPLFGVIDYERWCQLWKRWFRRP